ncbi:MAG: DNA alkylation repair protein [Clostridiales bacterium]|nr:DNA alkylation repair protein [Clostridiales bacterium]
MKADRLKERLLALAEPDFQRFSSALIPGIDPDTVLGVRLPRLRKIAGELTKGDWRAYLQSASDGSFEEIMLQGMVIGRAKAELSETLRYVERFLPKINNWSVCDSFCAGLKLPGTHSKEMWDFLQPYCKDRREYYSRFGSVMLLLYYMDAAHIQQALRLLDEAPGEGYYAKTAVAWAVSIYYVNFPECTAEYLKTSRLDDFTFHKALQKITESRKVSGAAKDAVRAMKRERGSRQEPAGGNPDPPPIQSQRDFCFCNDKARFRMIE